MASHLNQQHHPTGDATVSILADTIIQPNPPNSPPKSAPMESHENQQPHAVDTAVSIPPDTNNQPSSANSHPEAPPSALKAPGGNQELPAVAPPGQNRCHWFWPVRYMYDKKEPKDPHNEMRTVLLVVSALIAAITFQAGVNPPGGVWQDNNGHHKAGSAIYSAHKKPFYVFLVFNTLALSSSVSVIMSLTFLFPFSIEIWLATVSMLVTYGSSIFAIMPHHGDYKFRYLLFTAAFPVVARAAVETCRHIMREHKLTWKGTGSKFCCCRRD